MTLKEGIRNIFKINDAPNKIALGAGLGVFCGIMPLVGPLASLLLALAFKANRASALIGSLLTNTWLSFISFILAIKLGSAILRINWNTAYQDWNLFLSNFHILKLFKVSVIGLILPVFLGYFLIAALLGLLVYLTLLLIMTVVKLRRLV